MPRKKRTTAGTSKPSGLKLWLFRAPVYLYRARLGFLFGKRLLMVEHRGRKSDKLYRTVIEVVGRRADANEWIVTAGFGPKSDWYQNLQAGEPEAVWIGFRRHPASARFLEPEQAAGVLREYEEAHHKTAEMLLRLMGVSYDGTEEGRVEMMMQIPMVAFRVG